jgi:uncharacterized protein (TIGR02452 family)
MSSREERSRIAQETVAILARGGYTSPGGRAVPLDGLAEAVRRTVTLAPAELAESSAQAQRLRAEAATRPGCRVEVTRETTLGAARRLVEGEGRTGVAVLNFASAKYPGGGFLEGARAQEESLARASGLYACLVPQTAYYEANHDCGTSLYTDHLILSPGVPVFRDDADALLERPYAVGVITAPAPYAGAVRRNEPGHVDRIVPVLERRAAYVLAAAAVHGHRTLVLGAWGCGVFENAPEDVAGAFADLLRPDAFGRVFEQVTFAIRDRAEPSPIVAAFEARFGAAAGP